MVLNRKSKKNIFIVAMLLVPVVHFIIFWGVVNFNSILLSFKGFSWEAGETVSWNNFRTNVDDLLFAFRLGDLRKAFVNTFITSGFLILFMLPWGFFVTYFLYKRILLRSFWRVILFVPTIIPAIALTTIFKYMITQQNGPFALLLEWISGKSTPAFLQEPRLMQPTIIFYIFWTSFGGSFILFSGAMSRIPKEIIESARIDGTGMWSEMLRIILPLCWPTVSMLLLLNLAGVFTATGPIILLKSGSQIDPGIMTISVWIFTSLFDNFSPNLYGPATLGLICTAVLFPIILVVRWLLGRVYANVEF